MPVPSLSLRPGTRSPADRKHAATPRPVAGGEQFRPDVQAVDRRALSASRRGLLAGFLLLLWLPLLGLLSGESVRAIRTVEKREPAPFPSVTWRLKIGIPVPSWASIREFPAGFERWFNDRYAFRRGLNQAFRFAQWNQLAPRALTLPRLGNAGHSQVIVGREGWLFYGTFEALDAYRATRPFSPAELDRWEQVLRERQRWLADRGIVYVLLLVPEKSSIYPQYLPQAMSRAGSNSRRAQLFERARAISGLRVVDVTPQLVAASREELTYLKTDSHWNYFGAFHAYRELCGALAEDFPALRPLPPSTFRREVRPPHFPCDLATMLDSPLPLPERFIYLDPGRPWKWQTAPARPSDAAIPGFRRSVAPAGELKKAVVLHDSFFVSIMPFFDEHWREAVYAPYVQFPQALIEAEQPQVVVQELVERYLYLTVPENPSERIFDPPALRPTDSAPPSPAH